MDLIKILPYTMENKILKEQLLVVAPSFLDELGHFEYINEISDGLAEQFEVKVLCQNYSPSSLRKKVSENIQLIEMDFNTLNLGDSLNTKIFLKNIPFFKNLLHGFFKILFNVKIHKFVKDSTYQKVLYLEAEPLSFLLFSYQAKKIIMTLHAVDFNRNHSGLRKIYKVLLGCLLPKISKKLSFFAVHTRSAEKRIIKNGIKAHKVFVSGWGAKLSSIDYKERTSERINCLSFGVIRKTKRIRELIKAFLHANDSRLNLKVVGKIIDEDINELQALISNSESKTIISIEDRFVDSEEFPEIFTTSDLVILSHEKSFQSISGPLFNAVEFNKPILCFSYNDTKELVEENNLGIVHELEDMEGVDLYKLCEKAEAGYVPNSMQFFLWKNIVKRIVSQLRK